MELSLLQSKAFVHRGVDLVERDRCIDSTDVHHGRTLLPVQVSQPGQRRSAVECDNKSQVFIERPFRDGLPIVVAKSHTLPVLALVLAEVKYFERAAVLNIQ